MNSPVDHAIFASVVAQKLNGVTIFLKAAEISSPISDSLRPVFVATFCLFFVPYQ